MGRKKSSKGSAFVRYYGPLLDALRELGGSGRPGEVADVIAKNIDVPSADQEHQLKSGISRFNNQVQWARHYLVRAGLIDSSRRGVWTLTAKGNETHLDDKQANSLFQEILAKYLAERKAKRKKKEHDQSVDEDDQPVDEDETDMRSHREELLDLLKSLPPDGFERLSQRLLRECDFQQVTVTGRSGDGGIDGHGTLVVNEFVTFLVDFQCKRYQGKVGSGAIRDFRGAMAGHTDKGVVITTGTFTTDARKEAVKSGAHPIELVDGDRLIDMFEKLELGLEPVKTYKVDTSFFDQFRNK